MPTEKHDIPKEFYSFETGAPFTKCIDCGRDVKDGTPYLIEKAIKNHIEFGVKDTVFDYALCIHCAEDLKNELSKESMEAMTRFFSERADFQGQFKKMEDGPLEAIRTCLVSGRNVEDCAEYQIYAYCIGDQLATEMPPYMISGEVLDELLPLLSKKTTDDLNRFFNKHFAPDPSLMQPIRPKLILV